jgi:hypothetical protein
LAESPSFSSTPIFAFLKAAHLFHMI